MVGRGALHSRGQPDSPCRPVRGKSAAELRAGGAGADEFEVSGDLLGDKETEGQVRLQDTGGVLLSFNPVSEGTSGAFQPRPRSSGPGVPLDPRV